MNRSISKLDWVYILKCIIGVVICYWLYITFPQYPLFWSIISVVLVISPENDKRLAYIRIICNLLGSGIALLMYFLPLPTIVIICLSISFTMIAGMLLNLKASLRTAAAASLIVLVQEKLANSWNIALQRVGCVAIGCIVGFIITIVFTRIEKKS